MTTTDVVTQWWNSELVTKYGSYSVPEFSKGLIHLNNPSFDFAYFKIC